MLNMASSGENVQDSTSENGDLHVSREDTVSLVKTIISSEFRDLKKQLLNTNKPVNYLKRKYPEEGNINFKYTGNQKQYDFNCSVLFKLEELKKLLEISVVEDIEASIDEIVKDINSRNKLIKIADRTEGGWTTVEEYQQIDYADDSDDDRKIRQANARALQKKRHLQRRTPVSATTDINHRGHLFRGPPRYRTAGPSDTCFRCGLGGHFRRDCRTQIPNGMSSEIPVVQSYTQPFSWGSAALPTSQAGVSRKLGN